MSKRKFDKLSNMEGTCENGKTVPYAPCENLFRSSCVGCSKRICVQHLKRHKRLNGEIWEQGAVCLDCSAKAVVSGQPINSIMMPTLKYEACPLDENTPWFKRF